MILTFEKNINLVNKLESEKQRTIFLFRYFRTLEWLKTHKQIMKSFNILSMWPKQTYSFKIHSFYICDPKICEYSNFSDRKSERNPCSHHTYPPAHCSTSYSWQANLQLSTVQAHISHTLQLSAHWALIHTAGCLECPAGLRPKSRVNPPPHQFSAHWALIHTAGA